MNTPDYFDPNYKPRKMTLREFFGPDYDKGETFIPHAKNQPVSAPVRSGKQGVSNPRSLRAKGA